MQLPEPLVRLPLRADADRLAAEVLAIEEANWRPHPEGFPGNDALPLVSRNGDPGDDAAHGAMRPTPHLARLPYVQAVIASLGTVVGRTRLMRLSAASEATPHVDVHHYWLERVRVHVPIVTDPSVRFVVGDSSVHMAAGECWVFDTWSRHSVQNPADISRIHLVIDTVGTSAFWRLVHDRSVPDRDVMATEPPPELVFETVNRAPVMSPWELERLFARVLGGTDATGSGLGPHLATIVDDWRALWAAHGDGPAGRAAFMAQANTASKSLERFVGAVTLANGYDAVSALRTSVLSAAVDTPPNPPRRAPSRSSDARTRIVDPVIILSPPRSGSTLLYEVLTGSPDLWSIGTESHRVLEGLQELHPASHGWRSNRLEAADATADVVTRIHDRFLSLATDREGRRPEPGAAIRLLEKTPKNSLRVPFLRRVFPDARFVLLYRDPLDSIASIVAGWQSGRFVTYPNLPGWQGLPWSYLLVPGWEELAGKPIAEIAAEQWRRTMQTLLDDLDDVDPDEWAVIGYGPLVKEPQQEIERLCRALDVTWDRTLDAPLPLSKTTLTPPDPAKRDALRADIATVEQIVGDTAERARELFANPPGVSRRRPSHKRADARVGDDVRPGSARSFSDVERAAGFSSEATGSFAALLRQTGSSVVVSTYQSRRLIILRELDGTINTHFLAFDSPMGVSVQGPDMALAAGRAVWLFRDRPAVLPRLDPPGRHDACFVPRRTHFTGDIKSHDLAYGDDGLWVVATLFNSLATIDDEHSFVPRWRPSFISALAAEDRCHLNGLAMVDGRPGFVTCFGRTDVVGGWRKDGAATRNGMVLHVDTSEPVIEGLCMPHSPRWYNDQLWLLESGKGTLCVLDVDNGKMETVAKLPGFTRGLSFLGPYALVGLSQVRETVFDGVPVKEGDRSCGVWAVDTRTGKTVAWLRFSGIVQELYDVQGLVGRRFPTVLEADDELTARSFVIPDEALAEVAR